MDTTLIQIVNAFPQSLVSCIGDIMLDVYMYGKTNRISPEAPVPVVNITHTEEMLGGLGNVINNLNSLSVQCEAHAIIGTDQYGGTDRYGDIVHRLLSNLKHCKNLSIQPTSGKTTTVKKRIVVGSQQLLRIDEDQPISEDLSTQLLDSYINHVSSPEFRLYITYVTQLYELIANGKDEECEKIRDKISSIKGITKEEMIRALWYSESLYSDTPSPTHVTIISDYGKGSLTPNKTRSIIINSKPGIVIIDPKGDNYGQYTGAYCITPNRAELKQATRMPVETHDEVIEAARTIIAKYAIPNILVTLSEDGMILVQKDNAYHIPTHAKQIYDVSGAGDTVIATLAAALSTGANILDAAKLANIAAGIVVGKRGTATVTIEELIDEISDEARILTQHSTQKLVEHLRKKGPTTIGFANGCFDLLHQGHISLLKEAATKVDHLIIGLNSDKSIKRLKGTKRPIYNQHQRAFMLSELKSVTAVTIFDEDTPIELIKLLRPDIIFKGSEYHEEEVIGYDFIKEYGGKVEIIKLIPGISTTDTLSRINS